MHFIFVATFGAIVDNNRLITSKIMNNRLVWYITQILLPFLVMQ